MTTPYTQSVHTLVRGDVRMYGFLRENTRHHLWRLGYTDADVAALEARLKEEDRD